MNGAQIGIDAAKPGSERTGLVIGGGRQSGRTIRHLAHLLDLAARGVNIVHVSPNHRLAECAFKDARDLVPGKGASVRGKNGMVLEFGTGEIRFTHLKQEPMRAVQDGRINKISMDHSCVEIGRPQDVAAWREIASWVAR